jgi:dimethylamine/trimethylamine dehydrogenase
VAVRFAVEELLGSEGITYDAEGHDVVAMLAELPDLWDVNVSNWANDSMPSRFGQEGHQERYVSFVKTLTSKPVVGVGRYTSPDSMVRAVRSGILDMIGAARPSIADPFLPIKIREGRLDDIRECIGCNICVTGDTRFVPIRCTQNPTMGEEWRRGWHPEMIEPKSSDAEIMVVGAGPAGLECARALGQRGYQVALLDACREPGGRVLREAGLPSLNEWRRVLDWRLVQIRKCPNVAVYPSSLMTAESILEAEAKHVVIATGATWRRDGIGRTLWKPIPGSDSANVFTPDDLLGGRLPSGRIVLYDDDHYYMGGVLAELLATQGCQVTLITPAPLVSYWSIYTLEQERVQRRLMQLGVTLYVQHTLASLGAGAAAITSAVTGQLTQLECDAAVLITDRISNDRLYYELKPALESGRLLSLRLIGDAEAPNIIAQAVFSGHLAAREFDEAPAQGTPFKIERPAL